MVGICVSLDRRFHELLKFFGVNALKVHDKMTNIDELIIAGVNQAGYVLGSSFYLPQFLALNPQVVVYTLLYNNKLATLKKEYNISIVSLIDLKYQMDEYQLKLAIVKKFNHNNLSQVAVYGNDDFALTNHLQQYRFDAHVDAIINFDAKLYDNLLKLRDKTIYDFTNEIHGFKNLLFKDDGINFYAINQYLGIYYVDTGAKLIYESWERNRVGH